MDRRLTLLALCGTLAACASTAPAAPLQSKSGTNISALALDIDGVLALRYDLEDPQRRITSNRDILCIQITGDTTRSAAKVAYVRAAGANELLAYLESIRLPYVFMSAGYAERNQALASLLLGRDRLANTSFKGILSGKAVGDTRAVTAAMTTENGADCETALADHAIAVSTPGPQHPLGRRFEASTTSKKPVEAVAAFLLEEDVPVDHEQIYLADDTVGNRDAVRRNKFLPIYRPLVKEVVDGPDGTTQVALTPAELAFEGTSANGMLQTRPEIYHRYAYLTKCALGVVATAVSELIKGGSDDFFNTELISSTEIDRWDIRSPKPTPADNMDSRYLALDALDDPSARQRMYGAALTTYQTRAFEGSIITKASSCADVRHP